MSFSLFGLWTAAPSARPVNPSQPRFRPLVEGFEDRVVPAAPVDLGPALAAPAAANAASILPINITNVAIDAVNGVITAVGTIGNQAFEAVINLTTSPPAEEGDCPILNLEVGAINLNLLGLQVETSDICVNIAAEEGPGNLLGNLLCDVAGLLDGGLDLGDILGGLSLDDLDLLAGGLTQALDQGLGQLFSTSSVEDASVTSAGATNILNLSLGPINLDVLGLLVSVDNCEGGPVTVDITAQRGPGNLLGNLLAGLGSLLDSNASDTAIANKLGKVGGQIGQLL